MGDEDLLVKQERDCAWKMMKKMSFESDLEITQVTLMKVCFCRSDMFGLHGQDDALSGFKRTQFVALPCSICVWSRPPPPVILTTHHR